MKNEDKFVDAKYECIESFFARLYDEVGFLTEEYKTIPIGSIWKVDKEASLIVGEVHLDRCATLERFETLDWIEITTERLKKYFKILD